MLGGSGVPCSDVVNLPYDFGKNREKIMGGVGSGNWYRFDKKTTTDECHSVDVRYLHRKGLLMPGRWFSLRWSRAGRGDRLHQGCSEWRRPARADYLTLPPSKRVRRGMGRCAGARAPELDSVQLRWGEA